MTFRFRALELHGQRMWERHSVLKVLAFMKEHDMNALVLHESDLVHQIVYPRALFSPYALWTDLPSRRGENAIFNKRAYFHHLLRLAGDAGVALWVNVKEIGFSDEVLALRPELVKDGVVCPSEPFWTEYMQYKTDELFGDFPELAGMIVSFGSQESRASRVQNRCRCDLCIAEPLQQWYGRCIATLHTPISAHGKRLAVRDFAYKPEDHAPLVAAVDAAPSDVIFCIKAMPHDFYVTFPDNPAIGRLQRPQWVEYDVMGQFFGWGIMPCFVLTDLQQRARHWRQHGVDGVIFRIEWERINDLDALDTLNEANLIAGAAIARGESVDSSEVCRRWLARHGWDEGCAGWLAGILDTTLPVIRHAAYLNDFVSADNSMFPRSIQRAWWGMEVRDALASWDPARASDLQLDRDKVVAYLREKDDALAGARALVRIIRDAVDDMDGLGRFVDTQFTWFALWVEGLALTAKVCVLARWVVSPEQTITRADVEGFDVLLEALSSYAQRTRAVADDSRVPHQVAMLIDYRRALDVLREGYCAAAEAKSRRGEPERATATNAR